MEKHSTSGQIELLALPEPSVDFLELADCLKQSIYDITGIGQLFAASPAHPALQDNRLHRPVSDRESST